MRTYRPFTDEERKLAVDMRASGWSEVKIARALGRNRGSVTAVLGFRDEQGVRVRPAKAGHEPEIPAHVLACRESRKELQHRTLTAALCGDPLPGYSALERRTHG